MTYNERHVAKMARYAAERTRSTEIKAAMFDVAESTEAMASFDGLTAIKKAGHLVAFVQGALKRAGFKIVRMSPAEIKKRDDKW